MKTKYIEYEGTQYYVDVERLFGFILSPAKESDDTSKTINQVYDTDNENEKLEISQKQIVETVNSINELGSNLRYDFIVNRALASLKPDANGCDIDFEETTFMQSVYFNTLINAGILVKVEDK